MWELWEMAGGIGAPEAYRSLESSATRQAMAAVIEQARDQDARAAIHLEEAVDGIDRQEIGGSDGTQVR